ncbi:MAG: NAD+ synthase [Bacteroidetes bacterium]|nr:NAD+ synthase [Bacteroidota bacterium]
MQIALAQLNYRIGDFEQNVARIIDGIHKAKAAGADLAVFAELSVCGYPPRDFLEFDDFIEKCYQGILRIAEECNDIAAIVGSPSLNPADKGKPLYNSAYFLSEGRIQSVIHKTLLPNYDVFDEYRYFEPNRLPNEVIEFKGRRIALTICEDLWNVSDDPLYVRNPMDELIRLNPDLIINIAASPFHYDQPVARYDVLKRNALTYGLPVFYVNHIGGQTELLFDGGSLAVNAAGELVAELNRFSEDFQIVDTEDLVFLHLTSDIRNPMSDPVSRISLIHDALVMGIRDYFGKMGFVKAILGLSGGIDSAVTLVLAAEALGNDNVKALLLPSRFSSDHSIKDAKDLAGNLGVGYEIIPIEEAFRAVEHSLESQFNGLAFNLTEENVQARIRAVIMMALSNKFGYILLNTSNKSEAAVGYGTLYGDMCGGLSVLGDVYKTQVYELSRYINREKEIIPLNSISKPPSAELRPGQKDSDSLPEYHILDKILYLYIEERKGPKELLEAGFDEATVKRVLKLVNTSEYKRYQTPPILRVSPKAFGMGRRMPIVGKYLS